MSLAPILERRRWLSTAGWVLLGVFLVSYAHVCTKGNDFLAFYDAWEAARLHGDIYALGARSHMHVQYAPHYSLALAPLSLLGPYAAACLWYALKVAAMVFLVRWVARAVRDQAPGVPGRVLVASVALPFLLGLNSFMGDFRLGQANVFVLLFTVLTVQAVQNGRPLPAAFFFSLAVVKVTAVALLPWFVLRRQWRFLASCVLVAAGWLAALAAWWGPRRVPELFETWVRGTAQDRTGLASVSYFENQSLQGVAGRLACLTPTLQRPLLGLPAYQWLWIVPCAAMVLVLVISASRDGFQARLPPEEFALGSLLMLLSSADSRWAHHVQLLVPLALIMVLGARVAVLEPLPRLGAWLYAGARGPAGRLGVAASRLRTTLAVLLCAMFVVLILCGRDVIGPAASRAVRALSLPAAIDLALVVFFARRLLRAPPPTGEERPVSPF